jgi:hypothetical protein
MHSCFVTRQLFYIAWALEDYKNFNSKILWVFLKYC